MARQILKAIKLSRDKLHKPSVISGVFEYSVLHIWEIYALENAVFYIVVYGPYKP